MDTGSMFLFLFIIGVQLASHVHSFDNEKLTEFERTLDNAGLDLINNMYENYDEKMRQEVPSESNIKQITDQSKHRVRRSVILDQVKAAKKTGNREELLLRTSMPHKKLLEIYDPTDIVPISLTLDPPYNTMEKPKFFAVANYRSPTGSYQSAVVILRYNETTDNFTVHQFLDEYAPYELESFSGKINPVAHKNFLSVAGFVEEDVDEGTIDRNPKVSIYEISPPPLFVFFKMQEFGQNSVRAMKYIQIAEVTYLILGMYYQITRNGRQFSSPSQLLILRFDVASNLFHFHSSLPGSGVTDIECFTVRGKTYLTVANYRDNIGRLGILSFIYMYNEQIRGFEMIQYLSTNGARDIEHFTLANEEFLVVANEATGTSSNKTFNIESDVYKLSRGRFELIQKLSTYGAVKWKGIAVPNCKQDVLLVYSDQRDNIDQVGIYTFTHDQEMFGADEFSIYHLDALASSFRPTVRALSAYALQDQDTGESSLYLIVGASDTSEGNTIYKLTYDIILTDSPLDAFKREVEIQLVILRETLNSVKTLLTKARTTLNDAVTTTDTDAITGTKTIMKNMDAQNAEINTLNVTGSILFLKGNETYRTDPTLTQNVSFSDLEATISEHNASIGSILEREYDFVYTNVEQNITSHITFNRLETANLTVGDDVTVTSNYINDMNISDVEDIAMKDEDSFITGYKNFTNSVHTTDVIVNGKVNRLDFSTDLVLQGLNQTITAVKTFTASVNVTENLYTGKINDIDVLKDVLFVNRPGVLYGASTFTSGVVAKNASIQNINGLHFETVTADRVTKSTKQNITGFKTFDGVRSNGDVYINGTINGIDLDELKRKLEAQANVSVVHGDKVFTEDVEVTGTIYVGNAINDFPFPDNLLLKSSPQAIVADKLFTNEITLNDVHVAGKADGIEMKDVVTLNTDQDVHGLKTLKSVTLTSDMHLLENNTVNGIDLSEFTKSLITTTDKENLEDLTFADTIIIRNSTISNLVNNETISSFREVFSSCLHRDGDQNITTSIQIINSITVAENLTAQYINNFTYPGDFATVSGNQTFASNKTFEDDVVLTDVDVNGTVNSIDVIEFNENIVTDNDGAVLGDKTIFGDVLVNGSLNSTGKINELNFTEDLLFYTTEQNITARKYFNVLDFSDQEVTVVGDIHVETTIDGVDLSELELSGMTVSKNETITGTKCFANTDYNRSVDLINGVDISALRDDIVTVNTDQVILSEKVFKRIALESNLNTTSTIDGVDVSELKDRMVLSNRNSSISGRVIFNQSLSVNGNVTVEFIDGVNMQSIRDDYISLSGNVTLTNLTILGNVSTSTLSVKIINNVAVEEIVYRSKDQIISGFKQLANASIGDLSARGDINRVNLTALINEVVFKDANQTIVGEKVFQEDIEIGSLNATGLVNGIDLRNWDIARSSGNTTQIIEGVKTFTGDTTIDHMTVTGTVNGDNITSLFSDAASSNQNHTIEHVTFDNGVEIHADISVNGSIDIVGLVNNVNLTTFDKEVLKTVGEQDLTSKYVNGVIDVSNINLTGLVNGVNISEDLVTKGTSQKIRGLKEFISIQLAGDVTVGKLLSGVNLTELATNTLFKRTNGTQTISGMKSFDNGTEIDDVRSDGLVDGLNITMASFVTLHTRQIINGRKNFTGDFVGKHTTVAGKVAGVDLLHFNQSRVRLLGNQTIISHLVLRDDVTVDKNIVITGLVNNIDISEFNRTSPFVNETELGDIQTSLTNTLSNQCKSLTYVKDSLKESAYHFDYFVERQSMDGDNIQHAEPFSEGNDYLIALSISNNRVSHCTNSMIVRWNGTELSDYQRIPTSGAVKTVFFRTPWNDSYLLIVNSKAGCPGIEGPSELYKWNGTSVRFQLATPLPTSNAVDAVIYKEDNYVIIFVSNSNNTLSSWLLTSSGIVPYSTLDGNPITAHVFNINEMPYLAVASRSEETSSNGYVNVYKITKGNMTMVQSIATKGASSVTSFTANGANYLVVANDHAYSLSGLSTYHLAVDVYSYSNATYSFEWFRSIPTYRAYRVTTYEIGSFIYLAVVHFDKSVSFYQFGLELGFQKVDELRLAGVSGITYMKNYEKSYVFLSSSRVIPPRVSKIMEINPSGPDRRKVELAIGCQRV